MEKMKDIQTNRSISHPLIEFRSVEFSYPGSKELILKNVDLKIFRGEKVGIIGSNGCGKSTLSKLLLGIYKPRKGCVYLNQQLVKWEYHYPDLGYVGDPGHNEQQLGLPSNLTVGEIISLKLKLLNSSNLSALNSENLTNNLGLVPLVERKIANLSTGERKRLMICLTFLHPPKIIILDEPFDGLDKKIITFVKELLSNSISDKKTTVLFISHSQIEIDKYTDKVYEIVNKELFYISQIHFNGILKTDNKECILKGKIGEVMGEINQFMESPECHKGFTIKLNPTSTNN